MFYVVDSFVKFGVEVTFLAIVEMGPARNSQT